MTFEYCSFLFQLNLRAICLRNLSASGPIPPLVLKTIGVKDPRSTWMTRWLYALFFSCSCFLYIAARELFLLLWANGFRTLMSKNALDNGDQTDLALTSNLAPSDLLALDGRGSLSTGKSGGSIPTSVQTSVNISAVRSRRELCLRCTYS